GPSLSRMTGEGTASRALLPSPVTTGEGGAQPLAAGRVRAAQPPKHKQRTEMCECRSPPSEGCRGRGGGNPLAARGKLRSLASVVLSVIDASCPALVLGRWRTGVPPSGPKIRPVVQRIDLP